MSLLLDTNVVSELRKRPGVVDPGVLDWPVDVDVALRAAHLHAPDHRPERDAFIAATADVLGLTVVRRNLREFQPIGVAALDPWAPGQ